MSTSIWKMTLGGGLRAGCLAAAVCSMAALWSAQAQQQRIATSKAPARISVVAPQATGGQVVTLDLVITGFKKPENGNIGGVVALKRPADAKNDARTVEVGRFSIFPPESFTATSAEQGKRFQFNVTAAWKELGLSGAAAPAEVEVEVALVDRSNGNVAAGAKLTVGEAQIAARE
jgi:hypothetical protein